MVPNQNQRHLQMQRKLATEGNATCVRVAGKPRRDLLTNISSSGTLERRSSSSLLGTECGLRSLLRNLLVPQSIRRYLMGTKQRTTQARTRRATAIHDRYGTVKLKVLRIKKKEREYISSCQVSLSSLLFDAFQQSGDASDGVLDALGDLLYGLEALFKALLLLLNIGKNIFKIARKY